MYIYIYVYICIYVYIYILDVCLSDFLKIQEYHSQYVHMQMIPFNLIEASKFTIYNAKHTPEHQFTFPKF